jgi:hypothetical protein
VRNGGGALRRCITLCGCAGPNAGPTPAGAPGMLETGWLRRCAGENARCPAPEGVAPSEDPGGR